MSRRKALKSTWFNRLVVAPLILTLWITLYPPFVILVALIAGFLIAMKEYLLGVWDTFYNESYEYVRVIKDGFRFVCGKVKNK